MSDGRLTDVRRTSVGRPTDVRGTSVGRPTDVRRISDGVFRRRRRGTSSTHNSIDILNSVVNNRNLSHPAEVAIAKVSRKFVVYFAIFLDAQDARGRRELHVVKISDLNDPWR